MKYLKQTNYEIGLSQYELVEILSVDDVRAGLQKRNNEHKINCIDLWFQEPNMNQIVKDT